MTVNDLMTQPPITCHVNDTLNAAALQMRAEDCGAIAVVNDEGKLAGIVTDRDICMAASTQARLLDDMLVNIAMSTHVVTASPDQTILEIEKVMARHKVRRIPVIDADRKPIGLISLDDLARHGKGLAGIGRTLAAICQRAG